MAILIAGATCSLCGKPMLIGQSLVRFPPFVGNEADPLSKFSDGAFHEECFRLDALSGEAESRLNEMRSGAIRPIGDALSVASLSMILKTFSL